MRRVSMHTAGRPAACNPSHSQGGRGPGFQAQAFDRNCERAQPSCDRLRLSFYLAFLQNVAGIIDDADGGFVERHIQAHEVRHDILRVIDSGGGTPRRYSAELAPDRNHPIFI
jgi:hypothetical protein